MVAIMASMPIIPAAHAAADPASEQMPKSTSDPGKFKALQQEFDSGAEVTRACLACHTQAAAQKPNASNRRMST
jgi:hypothetical protein